MNTSNTELADFLQVPLIEADRDFCEVEIDRLLERIATDPHNSYAFLVVGDAFCATTHSDLYLRAVKLGIAVQVIHNASIISSVGCCGLQVYRFGEVVSVPLWNEKWKPDSFYQKILQNRANGLHTLVLVDIKVKERTEINILRDKKIYEPPRFMTIRECVEQLLEVEDNRKEGAFGPETRCFGLARVGYSNQRIKSGAMKSFLSEEMGPPLHSFVICAEKLHSMEEEMYEHFSH